MAQALGSTTDSKACAAAFSQPTARPPASSPIVQVLGPIQCVPCASIPCALRAAPSCACWPSFVLSALGISVNYVKLAVSWLAILAGSYITHRSLSVLPRSHVAGPKPESPR